MPGHASHSFLPMQTDRARLLALASEEELALMKKTQQLAEEVRQSYRDACWSFDKQTLCTYTGVVLQSAEALHLIWPY